MPAAAAVIAGAGLAVAATRLVLQARRKNPASTPTRPPAANPWKTGSRKGGCGGARVEGFTDKHGFHPIRSSSGYCDYADEQIGPYASSAAMAWPAVVPNTERLWPGTKPDSATKLAPGPSFRLGWVAAAVAPKRSTDPR